VLRRPPTARSRLHSVVDALDVVASVLDTDPHTTALVLIDRRPPHEGLVACCSGPMTLADVDRLDELVLGATLFAEPGCRMVLVTCDAPAAGGSGPSSPVDEASLEVWRRMQARHRSTPVPLLDWLAVGGGTARSYAELAGPRAQWRPRR
jgi:hypothetical protein